MTTFRQAHSAPPALATARGALDGLGALFAVVDPQAWASMARPQAQSIANLVYAIGGKMDEGLLEAGYALDPASGPTPLD